MKENTIESYTIDLLRFPMAVMIMLLHSSFTHELKNGISIFDGIDAPVYEFIDKLFVGNITNIAVPLFFMISGYLFFLKTNDFTFAEYKVKIHKRIKSLLLPYFLWNIIIFFVYLFVQNLMPQMTSGRTKLIADYSLYDYLLSFWSMSYVYDGGMNGPMDSPLWFVRDLIIMVLLSPVIYWLVKKLKWFFPAIALTVFITNLWQGYPGLSITAIAFFSLGAYLGLNKIRFAEICTTHLLLFFIVYVAVLVLQWNTNILYLHYVAIILGIALFCGTAAYICEKGFKISTFLVGSTFFVFASHAELLKICIRLASKLGPVEDLYFSMMYFVCPMVTLSFLLVAYWLLRRYVPKLSTLLSGGR